MALRTRPHEYARNPRYNGGGPPALYPKPFCLDAVFHHLFPRLSCPACGKSVRQLPRRTYGADFFALTFAELPYWLVFGLCLAVGMVDWLAGVVAFVVFGFAYFLWHRSRSRYECDACAKQVTYAEAIAGHRDGV